VKDPVNSAADVIDWPTRAGIEQLNPGIFEMLEK
jgi:hypothetical protein